MVAEGPHFLVHAVVALEADALRNALDATKATREAVPERLKKNKSKCSRWGTTTHLDRRGVGDGLVLAELDEGKVFIRRGGQAGAKRVASAVGLVALLDGDRDYEVVPVRADDGS